MTSSVLAITSSPRHPSNSETLLDYAVEGCRETGASVEKIRLTDFMIRPCIGCNGCHKTTRCVLSDDYQMLHDKLQNANHLIFAMPVYFGSMCAQLKCLIDRGQTFWVDKYILKNKPAQSIHRKALLLITSDHDNVAYVKNIEEIFRYYFLSLNIKEHQTIYQPHLENKQDILNYPETLERCRIAGKQLCVKNLGFQCKVSPTSE